MASIKALITAFLLITTGCVDRTTVSSRSQRNDKLIAAMMYHHETDMLVIIDELAKTHNIDTKIKTERVAPTTNYWTPLCFAAFIGNEKATKLLIEKGANVNYKDSNGETPVILAATAGNIEEIDVLLRAGASINEADINDSDALVHASAEGNLLTVKYLIKKGCRLAPKNGGLNALDFAIYYHHKEVIDYLTSKGLRKTNDL